MKYTQRRDETPDLFAMRVWASSMKLMEPRAMIAAANWIQYATEAFLKANTPSEPNLPDEVR